MADRQPAASSGPALPSTVAVIGLGLMGGSLARELARRGTRVLVHDARLEVATAARDEGVAAEVLDSQLSSLADAEVVILATPVDAASRLLELIATRTDPGMVVTDLGSTKESICRQAEVLGIGVQFVGSHPLTGDHRSGWAASRLGLFTGAPVFLCPTSATDTAAVDCMRDLWTSVGAVCEVLSPAEHDLRMAWVSHLPQITSSALALALRGAELQPSALDPGGRDMIRLAASSPEVWNAICLENAANIVGSVDELLRHLSRFRRALAERDATEIGEFLRDSRDWHVRSDGVGNGR